MFMGSKKPVPEKKASCYPGFMSKEDKGKGNK
jgi:hypothetical protein